MKKLLLPVVLLVALLVGCRATETSTLSDPSAPTATPSSEHTPAPTEVPPSEKTKYIRISPQEAETMMSAEVVILDVRTQEEFDEGHIKDALLLPDYEIKETAASLIAGKKQTVLVYCKDGSRSETASKELIEMGYTAEHTFEPSSKNADIYVMHIVIQELVNGKMTVTQDYYEAAE